jgi:hypothetical protein
MPIRTNRGRTAVYRRLWGWPLRSPRHLIGTLVILAVLVTAMGILVPKVIDKPGKTGIGAGASSSATTSSSRPGLAVPVPATSSLPPRLSSPPPPTSAPPNQAGIEIAKKWVTAWANHPDGVTNEQWLKGLEPYTDVESMAKLASVDPSRITATKIVGEPGVLSSHPKSMKLAIATDDPKVKLEVTVIETNAGWRVAGFEEAA